MSNSGTVKPLPAPLCRCVLTLDLLEDLQDVDDAAGDDSDMDAILISDATMLGPRRARASIPQSFLWHLSNPGQGPRILRA